MTATAPNVPGTDAGHGHVWPRPDGRRARCGGARMCQQCRADQQTLADTSIAGIRVYRPGLDRPIIVDLNGTTAAELTTAEAALVAAQLAAAISHTERRQ